MGASPYFDSAGMQVDESKAALLKAVATGGTAGKQAFDAAQQQAAQAKQEAVARAAERSALYGIGGNDQTFLGAYDARANQAAVNRAGFESGLAQTQASGESYLEKARGAIPVLQGININKAADEETKIKLAIQAAKDKAQADLDKENRSLQRTLASEARSESRAIARENRAAERAAVKAAAAEAKPTTAKLLGAGTALADAYNGFLGRGNKDANQNFQDIGAVDAARALAAYKGMDPATINSFITPQAAASYNKAATPPQDIDAYAKSLATKYASKGVTPALAKSVVGNVDFQAAANWLLSGAEGKTRDEVENILRENFIKKDNRNWLAEYNVLVGEYLSRIPTGK